MEPPVCGTTCPESRRASARPRPSCPPGDPRTAEAPRPARPPRAATPRDPRYPGGAEAAEALLETSGMSADLRDGCARRRLVSGAQRRARLDVEARAEGAARPLQDGGPHTRRRIHCDGGLPDALPHFD